MDWRKGLKSPLAKQWPHNAGGRQSLTLPVVGDQSEDEEDDDVIAEDFVIDPAGFFDGVMAAADIDWGSDELALWRGRFDPEDLVAFAVMVAKAHPEAREQVRSQLWVMGLYLPEED